MGADPNIRNGFTFGERLNDWLDDPYGQSSASCNDTAILVTAAGHRNQAIARALVRHGADVNVRCHYQALDIECYDPQRYTALQVADRHNKNVAALLRGAGAKE